MNTVNSLAQQVRQMIAVLEEERQALAALDLDGVTFARNEKLLLCEKIEGTQPDVVDPECRELLQTARQLNEVNRRVRNLLAANVAARIDAISGGKASYSVTPSNKL